MRARRLLARLYDEVWGRVFAAGYDRVEGFAERAGLRAERRRLLAESRGRTLEIGAGTGINVRLYPGTVDDLVLTEPSPHMERRLRHRAGARRGVTVRRAAAEDLPFPDASFTTIVCTFVLCSVPDPSAALRELARVLHPAGRLLLLEHVRAEGDSGLARLQDRFATPWRLFACGCRCDLRTQALVDASPFFWERVRHGRIPHAPVFVRPLLVGVARRRSAADGGSPPPGDARKPGADTGHAPEE